MASERLRTTLRAEDGGTIKVYDSSPIKCEVHGVETTWGELDPIRQLAVESGLDTTADMPCLLLGSNTRKSDEGERDAVQD